MENNEEIKFTKQAIIFFMFISLLFFIQFARSILSYKNIETFDNFEEKSKEDGEKYLNNKNKDDIKNYLTEEQLETLYRQFGVKPDN